MRLFNPALVLWGFYSLLIPQALSFPLPEDISSIDLQDLQADDENTAVPPTYFFDDSLDEDEFVPRSLSSNSLVEDEFHNDENTLESRKFFFDDSRGEHSLEARAPPVNPPFADCGFETGDEVDSGKKGEKNYAIYTGRSRDTYASVRLNRRLGGGFQGSVWAGELKYKKARPNEPSKISVAVKLSPGGKGIDQALLQAEVNSDYVLGFKELIWSANTKESIQVMQEGRGDLNKALSRGDRVDVPGSIRAVGKALLAAHRKSIVHRDVKPDNVLFGKNGRAYLIDWDLALEVSGQYTTRRAGQADYAGPEAASGEEYDVFKDDVFALALTWLGAEQPRLVQDRRFRKSLYDWITAPGDRNTKPGRGFNGISDELKNTFGKSLSSSKRHLIANGLCSQRTRFTMSEFMRKFDEVNGFH
ncbi:hypothetical protein N7492_005218 [Penicillium capsulatum]|uniref:Protein kinase domain-containing protein n=1 Tax=Penicillium capsulatum TaxID=69766 RepID=A0A9W9IBV7_9EURO|nr:hypothetical protein N7492_005218 [Penicillium capsulatum]KAJ6135677.1 hypothetical protein N7512_000837 [Penicillium capsulatum]